MLERKCDAKMSQHLLAFHNAIVYCQQKPFLTELVCSGDPTFDTFASSQKQHNFKTSML